MESKNSLKALTAYKELVSTKHAYYWFHPAWGDELKRGFKEREHKLKNKRVHSF